MLLLVLLVAPMPAMAENGDPKQAVKGEGYSLALGPTFDGYELSINSRSSGHDTVILSSDRTQWTVLLRDGFRHLHDLGRFEIGYFLEYGFKTLHLRQTEEVWDYSGIPVTSVDPNTEVKGWYASFSPILAFREKDFTFGLGAGLGYLDIEGEFMVGWWSQPPTIEPLRIGELQITALVLAEYVKSNFLFGMRVGTFNLDGKGFDYSFDAFQFYAGYRFSL